MFSRRGARDNLTSNRQAVGGDGEPRGKPMPFSHPRRVGGAVLCALLVLALPHTTHAEAVDFACRFDRSVKVLENRAPSPITPFSFNIIYDTVTGDAFIRGNMGAAQAYLISTGSDGFTFIEPVPSGVAQTTTILLDGRAVHSRHTVLGPGDFQPSQWTGRCTRQ
jgi:hypothetical protein